MRIILLASVVLLSGSQAFALDMPARRAGLWEVTMTFESHNLPSQKVQQCIDASTDKLMNTMGSNGMNGVCTQQNVQRSGSTITVDTVCKDRGATTTSHAVVSGDFNSAYTVKVTSTRKGGRPLPGGGNTKMSIAAKWLGACKAGQKPGDMIMAGGHKINIKDLQNLRHSMKR